jgi:uncharacterized protein
MRALVLALCLLGVGAAAHAGTKTIMTGGTAGTYIRIGQDIAALTGRFDLDLTVQPSAGSIENVEAVLRRPRTQLGIVQADVLDFIASFSDDPELREMATKLRLVFPLYDEEVHILARPGIATLADLQGRRVAVGERDSGTFLTASFLLAAADVWPGAELPIGRDEALRALRDGQIDAMFYVAGQPARLFAEGVTAADNLNFVAITEPAALELYESATIRAASYPWQTEDVPTVAVRAVLMAYDFTNVNAYQREACDAVAKVARIVHDNVDWLRRPGHGHPKWQQVDLDADVINWERSACAEAGLNGPESYALVPDEVNCDTESNAIRRKLCLVREQMRHMQPGPTAAVMRN